LIDGGTQLSAEEMVVAIKKYNVGVVVGESTRGWGTVEKVFKRELKLMKRLSLLQIKDKIKLDQNLHVRKYEKLIEFDIIWLSKFIIIKFLKTGDINMSEKLGGQLEPGASQLKKGDFLEFTGNALNLWKTDMGGEKFKRAAGDYSDRPGYTVVETNDGEQWSVKQLDGTEILRKGLVERWDDGSRSTGVDSNGDVRVELVDKSRGVRISTIVTKSSMDQRTVCKFWETRRDRLSPLITGEERFFETAKSLSPSAHFVESVSVRDRDGTKVVERRLHASEDVWMGGLGDRYRKTVVTSENGVVKYGSGEHGIVVGYLPEMKVVE